MGLLEAYVLPLLVFGLTLFAMLLAAVHVSQHRRLRFALRLRPVIDLELEIEGSPRPKPAEPPPDTA